MAEMPHRGGEVKKVPDKCPGGRMGAPRIDWKFASCQKAMLILLQCTRRDSVFLKAREQALWADRELSGRVGAAEEWTGRDLPHPPSRLSSLPLPVSSFSKRRACSQNLRWVLKNLR